MSAIDHSYGIVDICRISEDADHGYETAPRPCCPTTQPCLFTETVLGSANRVFLQRPRLLERWRRLPYLQIRRAGRQALRRRQAKVVANFHAIANNTIFVSEAFDAPYPEDRIELLKRISPPTMDVSYPVDLFIRKPAQIWNMPVERPFAKWNIVAVFNYTGSSGCCIWAIR